MRTSINIVTFFVQVEIYNHTQILIQKFSVFFLLIMKLHGLSYIYYGSQGSLFLMFSVFLVLFFLLLFPSLFRKLIRALKTRRWFWTSNFRFFPLRILFDAALTFENSGIGWSIAVRVVLIYFSSFGMRSEGRFDFSFNSLFDHLIEVF